MDEEKERVRGELIKIINGIEDYAVLKYLLILIQGKIKVGR